MEIVVETTDKYRQWAADTIQKCMENAGKVFVKKLPMPANPEIVEYWKH